jgi:trk system potassium uptake protein
MHFAMVQRILGLIVMGYSATFLPPALVAYVYGDGEAHTFLASLALVVTAGFLLWWPVRGVERDLRLRDGFLVVTLFWVVLGLAGAVPLLLSISPRFSYADAVFEAVSGFTTTGATVMEGLESLPKSILWYRQQLQWAGGLGIIVLAVALFPMLGIGGMQIYKAETPGPVKDEKLTPRMMQTAKALGLVYVLLTFACAASYYLAGMDGFDALAHAFSTVSTGGFSTHDARLAYFDSFAIDLVAVAFMFLGGVNYATHFLAWRTKDWHTYWQDPQFRAYFVLSVALIAFVTLVLYSTRTYPSLSEALRHGAVQVVALQSTTGFRSADFAAWPGTLPVLLMLITFVGGCAGSTAGGMKVIRWQLVVKQGLRELKRLVHPSAILPVKYAERIVPGGVLAAVTGFFAIYLVIFGVTMLLLMSTGLDQVSAWSAVASCINNVGPALGSVATQFRATPDSAKWICVLAMLIGRLEVFTLVVLFTPSFWRN